jgi:multiple sugar transport system substrate-binding protein
MARVALLYENSLVDMTDVAEAIGSQQGGWYDLPKSNCLTGVTYREDWFKEAGLEYPKTWDDFRKVGRTMKAKGKPFGQALGHSLNDPNAWAYPIVWMWGGMEVDQDGKTVALNSKNTVEAVKFTLAAWKDCFTSSPATTPA